MEEQQAAVHPWYSRSEGAAVQAVFSVEDLLDFSNEEEDEEEEEEMEHEENRETAGAASASASAARCRLIDPPDSDDVLSSSGTTESSSSLSDNAGLDAVAELCAVPYEHLAELEWLSGHLGEEEPVLSNEDIQKLRLISGSGANNTSSPSLSSSSSTSSLTLTSCNGASNIHSRCSSARASSLDDNVNGATLLMRCTAAAEAMITPTAALVPGGGVCGAAEAVVHPPLRGARSKRSRANPGSWASRLAMLLMTSTTTTAAAATTTTTTESSSSAELDLDLLHGSPGFVSTCSSSSSSYSNDAVGPLTSTPTPTPPPRKKTKPQHKSTKASPLLQHQPLHSSAGAFARAQLADIDGRRCLHCDTDKTPQWRTGPMGPKTLCNACGVRYKSGRLVPEYRPAASPTFVVSKHSNSHRKVMELRRQKEHHSSSSTMMMVRLPDGAAGTAAASPPSLLLPHNNAGGRRTLAHHLFTPLSAATGLYEAAAAVGAPAADDFLIHHHVAPDFRHLI